MITPEERRKKLFNTPIVKMAMEYADENKEAFLAMKQYDETDYEGNPIKTRLPPHSASENMRQLPFFKDFADLAYQTYFENKDVTFNLKDHYYKDGTKLLDVQSDGDQWNYFSKKSITEAIIYDFAFFLESYIDNPDNELEWLPWIVMNVRDNSLKLFEGSECPDCGQRLYIHFDFNTNQLVIPSLFSDKVENCPLRDDDELIIKFKVSVPSGKLIFANDLRRLLNEEDTDFIKKLGYKHSINSFLGEKLQTEEYAKRVGLIYCHIGNTCPTVAKLSNDEIIIGSSWEYGQMVHQEEDWEFPKEKFQGSICTDLWAFCAIDYDLFKKLSKENGFEFSEYADHFIVDVEKGNYEISHYYSSKVKKPYFTQIKKCN